MDQGQTAAGALPDQGHCHHEQRLPAVHQGQLPHLRTGNTLIFKDNTQQFCHRYLMGKLLNELTRNVIFQCLVLDWLFKIATRNYTCSKISSKESVFFNLQYRLL